MNPVLTNFVAKSAGWKKKAAEERIKSAITLKSLVSGARKAVPYAGLALGAGSLGYNLLKDRKIEDMENKRELVGALNDTITRQRIGDIYRMAGYPEPSMPLAVSREVGQPYRDAMAKMEADIAKSGSEKVAFNPWALNALKQIPGAIAGFGKKMMARPAVAKGMQFMNKHPVLKGTALASIGFGGAYAVDKLVNRKPPPPIQIYNR